MFEGKCVWSALYPISNHSHIRQLQFATHAFSQQVLQQAVQISICQWSKVGLPLMGYTAVQYTDCYLSPMSTGLLNSISSEICRQNTQFNMYSKTSKQQEGCTFKDSHPKCFITTNFDKFHREAVAKGYESR